VDGITVTERKTTQQDDALTKQQKEIRDIPDSHTKWLIQQIFKQKFSATFVIVASILSICLNMARPIIMGLLFDKLEYWYDYHAEFGIDPPLTLYLSKIWLNGDIVIYMSLILILGIIAFIVNISLGILNERVAQRTERDIRNDFYASVQSKSMAFHDTAKVGELMSQGTFDVRMINVTISPGLRMITQAVLTASIAISLTFYFSWKIGLVLIAMLPFYIWTVRNYSVKIKPLTEKVQTQFGISNALLQENVSGIRVVRAFTAERYENKRFSKEIDTLRDDIINRGKRQALYLAPLVLSITIAISLGLSVFFIRQGQMTVGNAIAINGSLIQLYDPTFMLSWVVYLTNMGIAGAKRILGTMKEEKIMLEKPDAKELENVNGKIEYRNVNFCYHTHRKKVDGTENNEDAKKVRNTLQGITFSAEPGEIIAILGPTGCGKSTITKLLARMYDPDSGEILIDGNNIKDVTLESLRKNIGVIEQDVFLFSTTLKENIAYGLNRDVSDEEVIEYAKAAQAHEFILSFDEGYETLVGERGVTLSGGQKQRISIARAFLADPKILILDDSASAIDAETEEKIQKAMDNLLQNRTVFIITHRLSTIKRANKIIVMRKGQIVSQGNHDQLLKTSEDYRRVFGRHLDLPPIETSSTEELAAGGTK